MSSVRIGDAPSRETPGTTRVAGGAWLLSPVGVIVVVPLLVAAVGLFLTLLAQRAMRSTIGAATRDRLGELTGYLAADVTAALGQSEPVLARLHALALAHDPSKPAAPALQAMGDLIAGHPGVAYVSISFPDGTFQGVYRDDDGAMRAQDSRVHGHGSHTVRYDFAGHADLTVQREEDTTYDPRERDFYKIAVREGRRTWTPPYAFFGTLYTGITAVEPVRKGDALHAVITVDFDIKALSQVAARVPVPGAKTLMYADDGTVLALPAGGVALDRAERRLERPMNERDVDDPVLAAFFASSERKGAGTDGAYFAFDAPDGRKLAYVSSIVRPDGLSWRVAAVVPEAAYLGASARLQRESLIIAVGAVVVAVGIALLFALHLTRARREADDARAAAREAGKRARELGSYRLVNKLGSGGMGEVWRAEHRLLARDAAIKLIRAADANETPERARELAERFRREAQTLAQLRSRSTIDLFDYGVTDDGTFFYVMELLDGLDLDSLVRTYGPVPPARAIHFLVQACGSLAEAHDAGLVHRDIKPANLFACRAADEMDVLKVLDFGLVRRGVDVREPEPEPTDDGPATANAALTRSDGVIGTPAFIAPEQALGHAVDGRADLYALACVGVWLLTGKLVFEREDSALLLVAHLTEDPPSIASRAPRPIPRELESVLLRCLAKDPDLRPPTARAFAQMLVAVPIPPGEEWTDVSARTWWRANVPSRGVSTERPPPNRSQERTIVARTSSGVRDAG